MNRDQLLDIIETGETQEVEFKQSFHSGQEFSKILCAFANTYGGIVLVGLNQKKEVIGVQEDVDILQQKISAAAQAVSPPIVPEIEVLNLDGKKVIIIKVQKAIDSAFHTSQGVIYVKLGSTLKRIEGNQMLDFLRAKQFLSFDEMPSNAKIADLDYDKIKQYLNFRRQGDFLEAHSIEDLLVSLQLATKNGGLKIKNAALMFFAKNPILFNPQMEIKLVRFEGVEPVKIVSHELVQADIVQSLERSIAFVKSNISKSITVNQQTRREEKYAYPLNAIREAIINAVAHRDYFSKDAIQIYVFDNRIEITNPGSLPQALPRELFGTISVQRNPITYRLLRDYGYVEGIGSGVPRMINEMRSHGLDDPAFSIYELFFRTTLRNIKNTLRPIETYKDLNPRQLKVIDFLKKNKSIKTKMYIKINKVSFGTAIEDINEMVKFGYLEKIGKYRGAYYVLSKKILG